MIRSLPIGALILLTPAAAAQDLVSFERQIVPILAKHCQGCHQPAKASGEIRLITHLDLLGGDSPVVIAGKPEESLLLEIITPFEDEPPAMPPDADPLDDDTVATLRRWIAEGALDDSSPAPVGERNDRGEPIYRRPPVVTSLAYSPDGTTFAVPGRGEILLHSADVAGAPIARLVGLSERIESIAFSPDGEHLAACGGSPGVRGELQIWDVPKRKLLVSKIVSFDTLRGASWSGDGSRIAFGCTDNTVRVVESATGAEVLFQGAHSDWVLGTEFSSDDSHLVTVSRDRSMKLIKVASQQFIDNITSITPGALRGGLMSVARRPSTDELLVGGADGIPKTYKMYREKKRVIGDDFNLLRAFERLPGRVFSVAWNPDGTHFVAGASLRGTGTVSLFDPAKEAPLWSRELPSGVYAVACRPNGDEVMVGGFDGIVRVLAAGDGEILRELVPVPLEKRSWKLLEQPAR